MQNARCKMRDQGYALVAAHSVRHVPRTDVQATGIRGARLSPSVYGIITCSCYKSVTILEAQKIFLLRRGRSYPQGERPTRPGTDHPAVRHAPMPPKNPWPCPPPRQSPPRRRGGHRPPASLSVGAAIGRPVRPWRTICRRQIQRGREIRKRLDERYRAGSPCGRLFAAQTGRAVLVPTGGWL